MKTPRPRNKLATQVIPTTFSQPIALDFGGERPHIERELALRLELLSLV